MMQYFKLTGNDEQVTKVWAIVQSHEGYQVSRNGGTVRLCLDRPRHGNSLTFTMIKEITSLFKRLSKDDSVHRIIITGRGRYFCTGMHLKEDLFVSVAERCNALQELFSTIDTCPKTTMAVINGPAFGGGVGLATVCDVRIAVSTAFFCLSEVKLGLCPATISKFLVREWGSSLARMAMLTGRRVKSQMLYDAGIIHALAVDLDDLEKVVEGFLNDLKLAAPQAAALCKLLVGEAVSSHDAAIDQMACEVFETMLAQGSEASHGIAQFNMGVKDIVWENLDRDDKLTAL
ncbi:enoyl-CoA hydratase/isomerase family protein [Aspergillus fijiensis CBS 313.89]|uniref:Enoyl-CoA hydratase/isomerase family protein n=1 Tax=Aspergillus fijiensis CBS 313.89 TaxID=1448319 RepID=A0A8G1RQ30_9EURO|nr:enoyl-CoA hydratase/isomerase family protein [Aspergillus fijiensis CBS 313.89]RAK77229.1 enoyl-CoA hydratase/isomerase family protein [Aspergillus fijiensis CBS 313.89]